MPTKFWMRFCSRSEQNVCGMRIRPQQQRDNHPNGLGRTFSVAAGIGACEVRSMCHAAPQVRSVSGGWAGLGEEGGCSMFSIFLSKLAIFPSKS